jgi:hypothetical protein
MRKAMTIAALAAASLSGPALADDFSYSYVELGYVSSEIDDLDVDGNGFGVRAALEFTDRIHGILSYSDEDYDFDIGASELEAGVGVNWSLSENLDVIGTLSYLRAEIDVPGFGSIDDSGIALGAGLRGRVSEAFELTGGLKYADLSDFGSETTAQVGARFYFTKMFALGADIGFNDDGTSWMLGGRFDFRNHR